ncbi:MAG: flavodoxin [Elusimicrobia bacterium]|nr:flavodoxin [Elusimicrobiota bacterium]MBU2615071.1 flavodoxin [Elusimicrobiota bacterium]
METGKKILVVFYSRSGNTERVAKDVATAVGADTEKLIDKTKRSGVFGFIFGGRGAMRNKETELEPIKTEVSKYDIVVLGTPVWAGRMTPAIRTYINKNRDKFKTIACIITAGSGSALSIVPSIEELSGKKAIACIGLSGGDLKNEAKYKGKVNKFMEELRKK